MNKALSLIAILLLVGCGNQEGKKPERILEYPTAETIAEWDGPSLASVLWQRAEELYEEQGLKGLNPVEKNLLAVMVLDGEVNNGGFGQWLAQTPADILEITSSSLREVGAEEMSTFVNDILTSAGGVQLFDEGKRDEVLGRLGDAFHEDLEAKSLPFLKLEPEFLASVYRYARKNWEAVRRP